MLVVHIFYLIFFPCRSLGWQLFHVPMKNWLFAFPRKNIFASDKIVHILLSKLVKK
jgi:hypothetical protein